MPEKEVDVEIQKFFARETAFEPIKNKIDNEFKYIYYDFQDKD